MEAPEPEPYRLGGAGLPLDLEYEDDDLLVVDKPAGLVVHPGAGHRGDTLADALAALDPRLDGVGGPLRAGIVHRLDKDTSGLIVVAKHEAAHARLSAQFQERGVTKAYTALVHGNVTPAEAVVEARIGRDPGNRQRMALISSGREAVTRYRLTARLRRLFAPRRAPHYRQDTPDTRSPNRTRAPRGGGPDLRQRREAPGRHFLHATCSASGSPPPTNTWNSTAPSRRISRTSWIPWARQARRNCFDCVARSLNRERKGVFRVLPQLDLAVPAPYRVRLDPASRRVPNARTHLPQLRRQLP